MPDCRRAVRIVLLVLVCAQATPLFAWDATAHRLSVYIALEQLDDEQREYWRSVLAQHPRFEQDFVAQMPDFVREADRAAQTQWLLGQAAIWPDLARGLPEAERARYNRPNWHWIDGAWIRDEAQQQGNLYLDTAPYPDIPGAPATNSHLPSHADNVLTALEHAHWQLQHESDLAVRALALCWLLHLIGDIHQPLHAGALVSSELFVEGDRGGNGIRIRGGNLHSAWDQALRGPSMNENLRNLLQHTDTGTIVDTAFRPTLWLHESRSILLEQVYPASVINNIRRSERTGDRLGSVTLSQDYQREMQETAARRVSTAGLRMGAALANLGSQIQPHR